jgi:hypothetical protein
LWHAGYWTFSSSIVKGRFGKLTERRYLSEHGGLRTIVRLLMPLSPLPKLPRVAAAVVALLALPASATFAQQSAMSAAERFKAPAPPVAPEVIRRGENGQATLRATRVMTPLRVDGRLDDDVYTTVRAISDFVQSIPDNGEPATQRTEAWILFDDKNLYIAARCYDNRPPEQWLANDMRRDIATNQDDFGVALDTFHDRRNGYQFYTNMLGRRTEQEITNEGAQINSDYNPVWMVRTARFEGGWTVEMSIPFKSLRYQVGRTQEWGLQMRRSIRNRGEWSWITPLPISIGISGNTRQSTFPTLVGLEVPPVTRKLEVKPYVTSSVVTDRLARVPYANDPNGDAGLDLKWGVTQNIVVDVTARTDVAQVEADDQQVNLTRFNIAFPEKREFFLEGQNLFTPPSVGANTPSLFYSRQIGLQGGRVVPILFGTRLQGKTGRTAFGAINVMTGEEAVTGTQGTTFTVGRVKRDILRRSFIGLLATNRSSSLRTPGQHSSMIGVDSAFGFFQNLTITGLYAKSNAPNVAGPNETYGSQYNYNHDRYGLTAGYLYVAKGFAPEVGFVARDDLRQTTVSGRFSPRIRSIPKVQQLRWTAGETYTANAANQLRTRVERAGFDIIFKDTQAIGLDVVHTRDILDRTFQIVRGVGIPAGAYDFTTTMASCNLANGPRITGSVSASAGSFYGGTDRQASYGGRMAISKQFAVEPSVTLRWTDLPRGSFTTQQYRARMFFAFTPWMFVSGLLQYNTNSHIVATNVRLRWEYTPGSELFLAYNEEQTAGDPRAAVQGLRNRTIAFKFNRFVRF